VKAARRITGNLGYGHLLFRHRGEYRNMQNSRPLIEAFNGYTGDIVGTFYDEAPSWRQRRIAEQQNARFFMVVGVRDGVVVFPSGTVRDAQYALAGYVNMCGTWQGYLGLTPGAVRWLKVRPA
jgi:hypothetical protein